MQEIKQFREILSDWRWRITSGVLYKIKNKNGEIEPFIPNPYQLELLDNMHYCNIILKARQLGFSTLIQILMLDIALFCDNVSCGVIAQGLKESKNIFENKVKFAYDNLPDWLRNTRTLITDSKDTLAFNNGSSFYVSSSFRSGTLQYLHISEYGKICSKYPDKAREINTGALESVGIGNYVFIESTAEGNSGDFYDKVVKANELKKIGKKLNSQEYKFFFFPWHKVKDYRLNDPEMIISQEIKEYFEKLEKEEGIKCDEEQKKWYQIKKINLKEDVYREYPSTYQEAFMVSIEGSYYQKRVDLVYEQKRICTVDYEPELPVYTGWDLGGAGGGDEMVVWFFQVYGKEIRFIDYFDGVGFSIKDVHREILMNKNYKYDTMFLPHDASVASMNDRQTRAETLRELGYKAYVLPRVKAIRDRIDLTRDYFRYCWFDKSKTEGGLQKVKSYRRKWSESLGSFLEIPEHEGSHSADGFGYAIQAQEYIEKGDNNYYKIQTQARYF